MDSTHKTELLPINPQERMNKLIHEVASQKPEDVEFFTRAMVSVELAKDALEKGNISVQDAKQYADSLINYNAVPVVIGTPECKMFPVELIMRARPAIVESYKKAALAEGIALPQECLELAGKAQGIMDLLEMGSNWLKNKYGPFPIHPQDAISEILSVIKAKGQARQILTGQTEQNPIVDKAIDSFIKLNFSNVFAGQELNKFIQQNYTLPSK
jgi:hypothetical protein